MYKKKFENLPAPRPQHHKQQHWNQLHGKIQWNNLGNISGFSGLNTRAPRQTYMPVLFPLIKRAQIWQETVACAGALWGASAKWVPKSSDTIDWALRGVLIPPNHTKILQNFPKIKKKNFTMEMRLFNFTIKNYWILVHRNEIAPHFRYFTARKNGRKIREPLLSVVFAIYCWINRFTTMPRNFNDNFLLAFVSSTSALTFCFPW